MGVAIEALRSRLKSLEELHPQYLLRIMSLLDQSTKNNQASLERIEEKLGNFQLAPDSRPVGPAPTQVGDPIMEETAKELRSQLNGLLESEIEQSSLSKDLTAAKAEPVQILEKPSKAEKELPSTGAATAVSTNSILICKENTKREPHRQL